jgi:predicted nuclease of restriction endonuclease-like (RecB) superfamily
MILSRCKRPEEREFYVRLTIQERWGKRELERQLAGALSSAWSSRRQLCHHW